MFSYALIIIIEIILLVCFIRRLIAQMYKLDKVSLGLYVYPLIMKAYMVYNNI